MSGLGGNSKFSGAPKRRIQASAADTSNGVSPVQYGPPPIEPYGVYSVEINDLNFSYYVSSPGGSAHAISSTRKKKAAQTGSAYVLNDLELKLETGSRCLLVGANGSGKSTLLRILAGRHLVYESSDNPAPVTILGLNAFRSTALNFHRTYLDVDWGLRNVSFVGASVPFMADVPVSGMMMELQNAHPARRDDLMDMLMIDPEWRMHELSDGQRRRVQILLALVRPFEVLLLDEVTTSLDVCVRKDLLKWLENESIERNCTIIYATHIFDGLDGWATHMHHLTEGGTTGWYGKMEDHPIYQKLVASGHPAVMLELAEQTLRPEMLKARAERRFERASGGNAFAPDPTDRNGGYGSGRNIGASSRAGRLSDVMGNSGVMSKHK